MPCYKPIKAYRDGSGKLFFSARAGTNLFRIPCGRCIGCRLERSRLWAARCMHEASLYDYNCFITLTYKEDRKTLDYRDFQLFMKRLRKKYKGVRFFMCGEYGEKNNRPHYHAILFNVDFLDKVSCGKSIFRSDELESLWHHGFSCIGKVTFESAAYVSRYVLKKVTGDMAKEYYKLVNEETGEISWREPEFAHMSLKPGIGSAWLDKYVTDVYPDGIMVSRGRKGKPPRYYDKYFKRLDRPDYELMKERRLKEGQKNHKEKLDYRLAVAEKVTESRMAMYSRRKI